MVFLECFSYICNTIIITTTNHMRKYYLFALLLMTSLMACGQQEKTEGTDSFVTPSGKKVVFTCIKHASIRINYDGKEIQIDPVTNLPPVTDYTKMPKADYIFVTHEHGDHFDKQAIAALTKPGTLLVTNARCAEMLGNGIVMANGDNLMLAEDIQVEAVPAYNTTPGREKFHPKGRDNGYVITLDGFRIYVAGDTEDIPEMAEIKNIDVAFLPCNQPYTMLPEQLARAARMINPKVLFSYHYSQTDMTTVVDLLKGASVDVRIRNYQ